MHDSWIKLKVVVIGNVKDWVRFFGSVVYLVLGIALVIFALFCYREIDVWKRFAWCLGFGMLGFALDAYEASRSDREKNQSDGDVVRAYATRYPAGVIAFSSIIFSLSNRITDGSSHSFYFLSSGVGFLAGYRAHYLLANIGRILERFAEWPTGV